MPFLLVLLGGAAGGAYLYDKVDSWFQPSTPSVTGAAGHPLLNDAIMAAGIVAGIVVAKKMKVL